MTFHTSFLWFLRLCFIGAVLGLCGIGLVSTYSAGNGDASVYMNAHLSRLWLGAGMGILAFLWLRTPVLAVQTALPFYAATLGLLATVTVMGHMAQGAARWLHVGGFSFQPSELAKLGVLCALAFLYKTDGASYGERAFRLVAACLAMALPVCLTLLQPDLGTALVLAAVGIWILFLAGISWMWFASGAVAAALILPYAVHLLHPYQQKRLLSFLNPEQDPQGTGYHILQSEIALGSSGWSGKGLLQGTQSHLMFLPEPHTDFAFALLVEDLGARAGFVMMGLFAGLLLSGTALAFQANTRFARLMAGGCVGLLVLPALVNMAMVMGMLPVVGIPLPFISYGGTALVVALMAVGIVLGSSVQEN